MKESTSRLRALQDERIPPLPALLGNEAVDLLTAALGGVGAIALSAKPVQVTWRPGRSICVTYDAQVAWSKHQRTTERFVARAGDRLPEGALILARDQHQVAVWRMAGDPELPGLAIALDPARVSGLLRSLDVPDLPVATALRAYRPGRRAVVEVRSGNLALFIKVVPPAEVPGLQKRHAALADRLPVPQSHGWSSEYGLVVLKALPGATLRSALLDRKEPLPEPEMFASMLDRIPNTGDGTPGPCPLASVSDHALLVRSILPELGERLLRLTGMMKESAVRHAPAPVHGDLHEAQVLVQGGSIVGLLDIDTAGTGHRINDWANFLGHLATWELSSPRESRPRIASFARKVLSWAESETGDPAGLRLRTAAVIIGMATGPFRAQSENWPADTRRRVSLAERWADEAGKAA